MINKPFLNPAVILKHDLLRRMHPPPDLKHMDPRHLNRNISIDLNFQARITYWVLPKLDFVWD